MPEIDELTLALEASPDMETRARAAKTLGTAGDPRAVPALVAALTPSDEDRWAYVSECAMEALVAIGDVAVPALIATLGGDDDMARALAAEALGEIGDQRAVQSLIQALKDPEIGVQSYAASALGKLGDRRAVAPLLALEQSEFRPGAADAQNAAEEALISLGYYEEGRT